MIKVGSVVLVLVQSYLHLPCSTSNGLCSWLKGSGLTWCQFLPKDTEICCFGSHSDRWSMEQGSSTSFCSSDLTIPKSKMQIDPGSVRPHLGSGCVSKELTLVPTRPSHPCAYAHNSLHVLIASHLHVVHSSEAKKNFPPAHCLAWRCSRCFAVAFNTELKTVKSVLPARILTGLGYLSCHNPNLARSKRILSS